MARLGETGSGNEPGPRDEGSLWGWMDTVEDHGLMTKLAGSLSWAHWSGRGRMAAGSVRRYSPVRFVDADVPAAVAA